jgi:FAD/FMN-containing dehydrogenase
MIGPMTLDAAARQAMPLARIDRPAVTIDPAALTDLARSFRGRLVRPGDPDYDRERSVWNGSIDRRPALIARCAGVDDVIAAVRIGRRTGLPVAVRSGGHSFPGLSVCDDGIVIDLRSMAALHVDREAGIARVQAGLLLGELDAATQPHGLAVPIGAISHTGLAGLTLGGGIGWLMRKHGLTIDQLLSVSLVTADGQVVTASEAENPELFWGVRGGGGNFGIVTRFAFRMAPVGPKVLGGVVFWALEDGAAAARHYRDWSAQLPDEMTTALIFRRAPFSASVPRALQGRPVVAVAGCWSGDLDCGERVLAPMRSFGQPLLDLWARRSFIDLQSMLDPSYPHGLWAYLRACDVGQLDDDVLAVALEHARQIESVRSSVTIWQLGGAVRRIGPGETAFGGRSSGHVFNISGGTESIDGFEAERGWARDFGAALAPFQTGVYVNFLMEEGEQRIRDAYGADRYDRLKTLKRHYDPDNFFRLNQNVSPA